jgi:hypothetical protein
MTQHRLSIVEEQLFVPLPTASVRILTAQPFLEFQVSVQEPYPMSVGCASTMSRGLDRVIAVAKQCERRPETVNDGDAADAW